MGIARTCSAFALALALTSVGCGGPDANSAKIVAGDMPAGEQWTGVYYHPVFGYLHLVEEGTNVVGRWKTTQQSHWGELSGTKAGNVLHYTWKEHTIGLVGAAAERKGRGYFVYKVNEEKIAELNGEFGIGDAEKGSAWNTVKQQGRAADLKAVTADVPGVQTPTSGKNWD